MSRYLQALRRLENQRDLGDPYATGAESRKGPIPPAGPQVVDFPDLRSGEHSESAFGSLLDTLRTQAAGTGARTYVLAGVSTANSTRIVAAGLAAQGRLKSLRFASASLLFEDGGRVLETHGSPPSRLSLSLSGPYEDNEAFAEWLKTTSEGHDLTVVDAPPLADCPDAAILAKACSGLVLAVQPMITDRRALQVAVTQAERVGCRLIGLVILGGREWLPRWLRRVLPTPRHHDR